MTGPGTGIECLLAPDRLLDVGIILLPMVLAFLVPNRADLESDRSELRRRFVVLIVATLLALALWAGLVLLEGRFAWAWWITTVVSKFWLAILTVMAWWVVGRKNPAWTGGPMPPDDKVRAASLVNRQRQGAVRPWMWGVAAVACLAGPAAIGLHCLGLVPADTASGDATVAMWIAAAVAIDFLLLPSIIHLALFSPEPLDAAGSPELAELYAGVRRRRVLGLFWSVVAGSWIVGSWSAIDLWFPGMGTVLTRFVLVECVLAILLAVAFLGIGLADQAKIAAVRTRLKQASSPSMR